MLKELLLNLEQKLNKSIINIDDKINTPVKILMSNISNAEGLHSEKSNRYRPINKDYSINNLRNNSNIINHSLSGSIIEPLVNKISQNLENKNSNDKLKLLEISMTTDSQRLICSPTHQPVPENNFSKERNNHKLLQNYQKQTSFPLAEKKISINYSNVGPFSPTKWCSKNNPDIDSDNSYCSDKKFYDKTSFPPEFKVNNIQQLISENQKENINTASNMAAKSENKLNLASKNDFRQINYIKGPVKSVTPINLPSRNASFQDIFSSNQNSLQNISTRGSQINSKIVALESFQSKVKEQILLVKTAIPKPQRRPSTSYLDKQSEKQIESINQMDKSRNESKPKFIKRDRSVNQATGYNSMTPNIQKNMNLMNGVNLIETINFEGTAGKKCYEIRSLDAERENLKVFRSKLNALSSLNLNEKNLTSNITSEIKNLAEEFKIKNYSISIKDQETLQTLNNLVLKGFNIPIIQKDKESKTRSSSVNPIKQKQMAEQVKKITATPSRGNENYNPKKNMVINLMSKGGFSTLNTSYIQALNGVNSQKNIKLTSNQPLKPNINVLNNKKIDVSLFEITKRQPLPFGLQENFDFLSGNHVNSAQGFM